MTTIAVLGLGAMGARMAANLLKAGHHVTVWNRTADACAPLVAAGAASAATPREAAAGANFVIAMVRDNEASAAVWLAPDTGALSGMTPEAIAIESSTLTAEWVRELGARMTERGINLLEAPVSGSRPQAESGQLIYLLGGDEATVRRAEPLLKTMGSAIHHVGPLGAGALAKLATNTLLGIQVEVMAELIGMLRHAGADVAATLKAVSATPVWSAVAQRAADSIMSAQFSPQFPVELIEKDFGYTIQTAGSDQAVPTIAAARGVFRQAIERGLGEQHMTAVAQLFSTQH